ncbi:MAG: alpha/beta fold hydrolase [Microthrixaceae bacterium]
MDRLAERFTVIAPDLLGHGASDKPRADYSVAAFSNGMRDLLDVLDIDTATVVGHSLGGGVAAQLAYQYPDRVDRLVLVSTGGVAREVSPVLRMAALPYAELGSWPLFRLPGSVGAVRLALGALGALGVDLGRDAAEVGRVLGGLRDRRARVSFNRTLRAVVDQRGQLVTMLDRAYLATAMPTLIVWGGHDGIIPVEHAARAHRALPGSRLVIHPEAGHFPHHEDPDLFVDELLDFIDATVPFEHDPEVRRHLLRAGRPATQGEGRTAGPDGADPDPGSENPHPAVLG